MIRKTHDALALHARMYLSIVDAVRSRAGWNTKRWEKTHNIQKHTHSYCSFAISTTTITTLTAVLLLVLALPQLARYYFIAADSVIQRGLLGEYYIAVIVVVLVAVIIIHSGGRGYH